MAIQLRSGIWSQSAKRVLHERYLTKNEKGEVIETPDEMCWRVATAVAAAEERWPDPTRTVETVAQQFYDIMVESKFLPNSPTLMNAGKNTSLQLSACYVLPVGDSMEEIFDSVKKAAIIHKSGGGTGFAFSRLRPKNALVSSSKGNASGPVSFLRVFNAATEAVKQGGTRRGANMGILRVDHPDILEFIECKLDGGIANFNISVAATDAFMQALQQDGEYDLVDPHTQQAVRSLRAREVFERIVRAAWRTGDPGLVFIERINNSPANPTPTIGEVEATNPCGEQPLLPNEACNLGSLNLAKFVRQNGDKREVDWGELGRVTRSAVRFLDDVIEVNPYPLPEIDETVKANRRIGVGIMGWADLLFELGTPYDSDPALDLANRLMGFVQEVAHQETAELARQRVPFPNWPVSIYKDGPPLRNSTVTTVAPTGTISIIADASSGIEPIFALAFSHTVEDRRLTFVNKQFENAARERGIYSEELMEEIVRHGSVRGLAGVPEEMQRVFVTAHEVAPEWHVRMQAAFQKHTDNGVSKTINLPNEATEDDVRKAYILAYEQGCLGITVFRDGCKDIQVLTVGTSDKAGSEPSTGSAGEPEPSPAADEGEEHTIKPRPHRVPGATYSIKTPVGTAFITVNTNGHGPLEVFVNVGKAGSDIAALAESLGRLISMNLRMPSALSPRERVAEVVGQLSGIGGSRSVGFGPDRVRSLPDAVAQVLAEYLEDSQGQARGEGTRAALAGDLCLECGCATLVYEEGCKKCHACGFSEC